MPALKDGLGAAGKLERTLEGLSRLQRALVRYRATPPEAGVPSAGGAESTAHRRAATAGREPAVREERIEGEGAPTAEAVTQEAAVADAELPFSSSTLAELYMRQGFAERALEVYRQVVSERPGDARARARLAEIEGQMSAEAQVNGAGDEREARRRALKRGIAELELLLQAVQRG